MKTAISKPVVLLRRYTLVALLLGTLGVATGLFLIALAMQWLHVPGSLFAARDTPLAVGQQVSAAVEQVLLQWRPLLVAIGGFQLLLCSAMAVAVLRARRLDPEGASLLRFVSRLAILFELLRLGPLTLVLVESWRAIRAFFPDMFPQLPGIEAAPSLSEAQANWLSLWMLALLGGLLLLAVVKTIWFWLMVQFFNRRETGELFLGGDGGVQKK